MKISKKAVVLATALSLLVAHAKPVKAFSSTDQIGMAACIFGAGAAAYCIYKSLAADHHVFYKGLSPEYKNIFNSLNFRQRNQFIQEIKNGAGRQFMGN